MSSDVVAEVWAWLKVGVVVWLAVVLLLLLVIGVLWVRAARRVRARQVEVAEFVARRASSMRRTVAPRVSAISER
jgi:cytochrome c-type biogenesis protein CcmH/NrfF